jgi:hypothetical protein
VFHHRAYELNLASELPLPGLAALAEGPWVPDVTVSVGGELPELDGPVVVGPWWQVSPVAFRMVVDGVATYQVEAGRRIRVQPHPGSDPAEVRLFLLGSALGALLYQRGLFPLHGSAVETPWGAMVFVGPSGIGKSTLAGHFHRSGYRLLCDDVCAIRRDGQGALQVLPAFPHLRLKADALGRLQGGAAPSRLDVDKVVLPLGEGHASAPVALGAVHVLADLETGGPRLTPLRGFERIQALADNLYRPHFLDGMQTRGAVLRLAGEIAASAQVATLARRRDAADLDGLVLWLEHGWNAAAPAPES